MHARAGLASQGTALLEAAGHRLGSDFSLKLAPGISLSVPARGDEAGPDQLARSTAAAGAATIYARWLHRLRILERFPQPDWSIADKWIAKELLLRGMPAPQVATILRSGSPGFPRQHARPDDYLRRTLACAARELPSSAFPGRDLLPHRGSASHAPSS
jgi:hypothetical protein